jgi:hypothetical protein
VSGPSGLPQTTFLLSGRRYVSEGYKYGVRRFLPTSRFDFNLGRFNELGDEALVPLETNDEWSGQFKISNSSLKGIQVSYQAIFNLTNNKPYKFDYRLNPDGVKNPIFIFHCPRL